VLLVLVGSGVPCTGPCACHSHEHWQEW
jgi:hypothetical protein